MFSPSGQGTKIVSILPEYELDVDIRPWNSTSTFHMELSLHSQDNTPMSASMQNWLKIDIPYADDPYYYDFGNDTITLQFTQMDGDPNIVGNIYDLRKEIAYGSGTAVINLPDLDGVYDSEEV